MASLRCVTYNCFSIRKKIDIVRTILKGCDILLCQEILLLPDDCNLLSAIDRDFSCFFVASKSSSISCIGRPIGG